MPGKRFPKLLYQYKPKGRRYRGRGTKDETVLTRVTETEEHLHP